MDQFKDYYQILDVDADASAHAIREAYREKIRVADPERGGSQAVYEEVQEAFDVLSDPEERQRYDEVYVNVNEDWGFSDDEHQSQEDENAQDDDPVMNDEPNWRTQRQEKPKPLFPEWSGWKKVGIASLILNLLIVVLFAMGITEVSDAQQEVQNVRTQEEELISRIDALEEENRELEEEQEQFAAEVLRLEEELAIAEETISGIEAENEALLGDISTLEEELSTAEEEAESAEEEAINGAGETFGRGASVDDVEDILGSPDEIDEPYYRYGRSTITIEDGTVTGWSDMDGSLPVQIDGDDNADTFSEGSSEEEVAGAMGTPNALSEDTWTYGQSTVTFSDGVVSSFDNAGGNLAIEE